MRKHFTCVAHDYLITWNEIGVEGAKAIGDALKTNTSLTQLDLSLTHNTNETTPHHITSHHLILSSTGNNIEPEGAKAIGEALKANTSLTKLDLGLTHNINEAKSHHITSFDTFINSE